ncbi:MAG: hypothetical protein WA938_08875 [Candidatus Dormiibacterota bacterium]
MGDGVSVSNYSGDTSCAIEWQQQGWDVATLLPPPAESESSELGALRQLVNLIHATHLPAAHGVVDIDNAGDGEHSYIYWAQGKFLYWVSQYHFSSLAFKLLGSVASVSTAR